MALAIAVAFAAFVFTPTFWNEIGADAKDWYAAGILSAEGGNPYSPSQLFAAQERLFNQPHGYHRGDPGYFAPQAYAYPPLLTRVLELDRAVDERTFYLILLAIFVAAGTAGFEMCMALARAPARWEYRLFFLSSSPMVLALFVGNPSPILLLASAAGCVLLGRGRPAVAGAVLSLTLVKLPVGLPVAAAALLFARVPGEARSRQRAIAAVAFGASAAGWLVLGVLLGRPGSLGQWLGALTTFQGELATPATAGIRQSGLSGLPGLLLGTVPAPVALAITLPIVLALLGIGLRRTRGAPAGGPPIRLALGMAAALLAGPYLHVNDLVLEALPLLVLATAVRTRLARSTVGLAALFLPLSLAFTAAVILLTGELPPGQAGLGVLLTALTMVALALAPGEAWAPEPESEPG